MYQKFSRMNAKSRSDSARNSPIMKKIATHVTVTFSRNGILALASASPSGSPPARLPRSSSTNATALSTAVA